MSDDSKSNSDNDSGIQANLQTEENVIISRLYTKDQAKALYPMYKKAIGNASTETLLSDRPSTNREDDGETTWPETDATQTAANFGDSDEYIRGYER